MSYARFATETLPDFRKRIHDAYSQYIGPIPISRRNGRLIVEPLTVLQIRARVLNEAVSNGLIPPSPPEMTPEEVERKFEEEFVGRRPAPRPRPVAPRRRPTRVPFRP